MATVKGDVHDIGKNIVGVVLRCNNYDVIDLGVMVPFQTILDTATREKADVIGLSGLITPSLDEMVTVAREMKRQGFTTPLLIGGATTSVAHTAVKIDPEYDHEVIHVLDASRAVGVVNQVLGDTTRAPFAARTKDEYKTIRTAREASQGESKLLSLADARARREAIDYSQAAPPPTFLGTRVFEDYALADLVERIDWTPFFQTWELRGREPAGPSGQELKRFGSAGLLAPVGASPGCWMPTNIVRRSSVTHTPVTSQMFGPVRKRRVSRVTGSAASIWLLPKPA
jgi:5-methyltetrahydrofolate--homocysteine methyltransferase